MSGAPALAQGPESFLQSIRLDNGNSRSFDNGYNYRRLQLRKAIEKNSIIDLTRLYDDSISPDWVMPDTGETLLSFAIRCNAVDAVTFLLTKNPDLLKAHNNDHETPIMQAARLQNWPIVEILGKHKQKGRDYSTINGKALVAACSANLLTTVGVLLDAGASTNNECMFIAIRYDNELLVTLLLKHNANLDMRNDYGYSPIHAAASVHK